MNVLPCRVEGATAFVEGEAIALPRAYPALPRDRRIELGIRPEFVTLQREGRRPAGAGAPHRRSRPRAHRAGRDGRPRRSPRACRRTSRSTATRRRSPSTRARSTSTPTATWSRASPWQGRPDDKPAQQQGLVPRPAGLRDRGVLGGAAADDGGELFGAGHVRQQPVLLERRRAGSRTCSIPRRNSAGASSTRLWRNLLFSAIILSIEIPLGIVVALPMPREGWTVALCLVLMALPLLIPWNVVGTIWQVFARGDIGLLGWAVNQLGIDYNYVAQPARRLDHHHRHGCLALDEPRGAPVLCGAEIDPGRLLPGGPHRRRLALGGVPHHPAAEDAPRPAHRGAAALHGFLHDLHRALRAHRRRARQRHDLPVDRPRQARARPVRPRQGGRDVARLQPHHPGPVLGLLHGDDQRRCGRRGGSTHERRRRHRHAEEAPPASLPRTAPPRGRGSTAAPW